MLYRTATLPWLQAATHGRVRRGDPLRGAAAIPHRACSPFARLPETVARVVMIRLGVVGSMWVMRRLGMPLWWLAFPPFIDGLYNGNPQVLLLPLLVAGLAPIAALVKIYAVPVPLLRGEWKAVAATAIVLLVTIPILPWAAYIAQFSSISSTLSEQSDGGMSALAIPVLIPVAVIALVLMGRRRAAWWVVPVCGPARSGTTPRWRCPRPRCWRVSWSPCRCRSRRRSGPWSSRPRSSGEPAGHRPPTPRRRRRSPPPDHPGACRRPTPGYQRACVDVTRARLAPRDRVIGALTVAGEPAGPCFGRWRRELRLAQHQRTGRSMFAAATKRHPGRRSVDPPLAAIADEPDGDRTSQLDDLVAELSASK